MSDSYTAREAAQVIGRSERLVRRLAEDGRLEITGTNPLRVSAESVHRERSKRKAKPERKAEQSAGLSAEQLEQIIARAVSAAVAEIVPRMLESRDSAEQRMVAELANAQQQIDALRRELETERNRPALRVPPIGWPFRR